MRVIKHDGEEERHVIVSLVLDKRVLEAIAPHWRGTGFTSKLSNIVTGWSVDYYTRYREAPGAQGITDIFTAWAATADETEARIIEDWLSQLPGESGLNPDYAIDRIGSIWRGTSLRGLGTALVGLVDKGEVEQAQEFLDRWEAPKINQDVLGACPLSDAQLVSEAFDSASGSPLIVYPGALGEFINPVLVQDSFVSFLAPEKTGKTTALIDVAWRAVAQGRRVAFFSCGDMSEKQVIIRLIPRVCNSPIGGGPFKYPLELKYADKEPTVKWETKVTKPVTKEAAIEAFAKAGGTDPTRFRLLTYPAGTITAEDISSLVSRWADEGWTPEVLVIDYADILELPRGHKEARDAINANWQELRALSTRMRCLVVTASQSDTEGYSTWLLSKKNFSDCKKKIAHVTAMIGLNMTEQEKRMQVCRYNYVALREAEFMADKPPYVVVAGCTKVGRSTMVSAWPT